MLNYIWNTPVFIEYLLVTAVYGILMLFEDNLLAIRKVYVIMQK